MQLNNLLVVLGLAALTAANPIAAPVPVPVPEPLAMAAPAGPGGNVTTEAAQGVCGNGYSIETFGSTGCGNFNQGISNSGTSCRVCVAMGNAKSWRIINPDRCRVLQVDYWHGAYCRDGGYARGVKYDTRTTCWNIPTDIGDHYSAQFTCVQ